MNVKKIDVPTKLYEYRDKLKKEYEIVGKFKRFDIVYVKEIKEESFIAIIVDYTKEIGYIINYIDDNGSFCRRAWIGEENITLVEKQNPTEIKDECDF